MPIDARTRARHVAGVVLPVLLCAGAVWVWGQAPSAATVQARAQATGTYAAGDDAPSGEPAPAPPAGTSPTSDGSSGSSTPTAPGNPTAPVPGGPGIDEPGVMLSVTPTSTGALEVSERARLSSEIDRIVLRPPSVDRAGNAFSGSVPVLTAVQLSVDGQPVVLPDDRVTKRLEVDLPTPTQSYELRYVLEGTTVRSVPSTAGRALAALAPASTTSLGGVVPRVVVTTSGDAVRNLTCPLLAGDARACADGVAGSMSTRRPLAVGESLVVLQLDLPRP